MHRKTVPGLSPSPPALGVFIAPVGQRQDEMTIGLGEGGAMPRKDLLALPVGLENRPIDMRRVLLQPGEERRAEVGADLGVVIYDPHDLTLTVQNTGGRVRSVALACNPFIPVVVRIGGVLQLNRLKPGVLPWGLIEMAVDADIAFHG